MELEGFEDGGMECVQHQYETTVMVPDQHGQQSWGVTTALDCGEGEKVTADPGFGETRTVRPMQMTAKARAQGGELGIKRKMFIA